MSLAYLPRAYPRSRGGTVTHCAIRMAFRGLSPLARGNPGLTDIDGAGQGPIPARAGEPGISCPITPFIGAYPRSRGGTMIRALKLASDWGLSPLARGNLDVALLPGPLHGPIPARAGEPAGCGAASLATGAYPRSRGGTSVPSVTRTQRKGLSPLARGNRDEILPAVSRQGPIPARAGEPDCFQGSLML